MYKVDLYTRQSSQVLMIHDFLQVELQKNVCEGCRITKNHAIHDSNPKEGKLQI
jgi:hypothetical protein